MYFHENRLYKYKSKNEYEFDRKLRLLNLEILEKIELNFKNKMIHFFTKNWWYLNKELYFNKYIDINFKFIKDKITYLKNEDKDIRLYCKNHNEISIFLFIEKLTFWEIVKIFRNLKTKYKKEISSEYNFKNYDIFENFVLILRYVRNICSHYSNLFNIKWIIKTTNKELVEYFENKDSYLVYFYVISLFENIICNNNLIQKQIINLIKSKEIWIEKLNLNKKNNLPSQLESEAWKVLVLELYKKYVEKSNFNSKKIKNFSMILAVDSKNWLGKNNDLAWKLSSDLKHFKNITSKTKDLAKYNAVIMWRKTWESIPAKYRPLPDRINCILSRSLKYENINSKIDNFVLYFNSFEHCLKELSKKENVENIFLIWWASLYNQFLNHPKLDKIYLTKVEWDYNCDVFFDWIPDNFILEKVSDNFEENSIKFRFEEYKRVD